MKTKQQTIETATKLQEEIHNNGFVISSTFKNSIYTVVAERDGLVFIRTSDSYPNAVISLWFDIRNNY